MIRKMRTFWGREWGYHCDRCDGTATAQCDACGAYFIYHHGVAGYERGEWVFHLCLDCAMTHEKQCLRCHYGYLGVTSPHLWLWDYRPQYYISIHSAEWLRDFHRRWLDQD